MYEKIARHIGHNTEVAYYGNLNAEYLNQPSEIVNVAVECMDCHEVIVDAENPEWVWEDKTKPLIPYKWREQNESMDKRQLLYDCDTCKAFE